VTQAEGGACAVIGTDAGTDPDADGGTDAGTDGATGVGAGAGLGGCTVVDVEAVSLAGAVSQLLAPAVAVAARTVPAPAVTLARTVTVALWPGGSGPSLQCTVTGAPLPRHLPLSVTTDENLSPEGRGNVALTSEAVPGPVFLTFTV
jgi:hypothetical protein